MDNLTYWLFAALFFFLVIRGVRAPRTKQKRGGKATPGAWAYYVTPRRKLLTQREAAFESVIRLQLVESGLQKWTVYAQVAMSALADARRDRRSKRWTGPQMPA